MEDIKSYRNADFKQYFCRKTKKHVWLLGYFAAYTPNDYEMAKTDFANETGLPVESVSIEIIRKSNSVKGFKYISSTCENQHPLGYSKQVDDVWNYLA